MIHGELESLHLGDLLQWLQLGGLSGRLCLLRGGWERRLDVLEGRLVYVSSTAPSERLATWLAGDGVAAPALVRRILARALLRRSLFTDLLLAEPQVQAEALRTSLGRLAETMMTRLLMAPNLSFTFDPTFPARDLLGVTLDIDPNRLLLEAARRTDEGLGEDDLTEAGATPFHDDGFEAFFWTLVRSGIGPDEPVDGDELERLHHLVRQVVSTLGHWTTRGPGLVPIPARQIAAAAEDLAGVGPAVRAGRAQVVWNAAVLACLVRSSELRRPQALADLDDGLEPEIWRDLVDGGAGWRRPDLQRLDSLTTRVAADWSRAAAAAAPELDVDPGAAALAAHLLVVPADLVLLVLSQVPVGHQRLRRELLARLPALLGAALARAADLPRPLREVFSTAEPSALAATLALAQDAVPAAAAWPGPVTDRGRLVEVFAVQRLERAAAAALAALDGPENPG